MPPLANGRIPLSRSMTQSTGLKNGKTPILSGDETRGPLSSVPPTDTFADLRDRASSGDVSTPSSGSYSVSSRRHSSALRGSWIHGTTKWHQVCHPIESPHGYRRKDQHRAHRRLGSAGA